MLPSRSRFARWLVLAALLVLIVAAYPVWLAAIGGYLVCQEQPIPAPVVVTLAGGWRGNRILKAAEMVRAGYAHRVLVSGPPLYGRSEADLAIDYAVQQGCPREWFTPLRHQGLSTLEEARIIAEELRRLGVKRFLLVTSDYHTRRSRACFRKAAPDLDVRVIGAADEDFPNPWWKSRQGWKTVLLEWLKTAAFRLGM